MHRPELTGCPPSSITCVNLAVSPLFMSLFRFFFNILPGVTGHETVLVTCPRMNHVLGQSVLSSFILFMASPDLYIDSLSPDLISAFIELYLSMAPLEVPSLCCVAGRILGRNCLIINLIFKVLAGRFI